MTGLPSKLVDNFTPEYILRNFYCVSLMSMTKDQLSTSSRLFQFTTYLETREHALPRARSISS